VVRRERPADRCRRVRPGRPPTDLLPGGL